MTHRQNNRQHVSWNTNHNRTYVKCNIGHHFVHNFVEAPSSLTHCTAMWRKWACREIFELTTSNSGCNIRLLKSTFWFFFEYILGATAFGKAALVAGCSVPSNEPCKINISPCHVDINNSTEFAVCLFKSHFECCENLHLKIFHRRLSWVV